MNMQHRITPVLTILATLLMLPAQAAEPAMRCGAGMSMKKPAADNAVDTTKTPSDETRPADGSTPEMEMGMDMGDMNMQGGPAPADARDPHAFSDGYTLNPDMKIELMDEESFGMFGIDRLERVQATQTTTAFTTHGWYGRNYNKLVFMSEGDVVEGKLEESMSGLYWGHAIDTYWDMQLGVRHDTAMGPNRNWLGLGVQGLAPYWFEVRALAYVGNDSRTAVSFEAEYELLFTQRLILQPAVELNAYGKSDMANDLGSGLADVTAGLRLRYEFTRQFAPYAGIEWKKLYGETADMAQAMSVSVSDTHWVAGLRFWY